MSVLQWDQTGEKVYENGVEKGVFYTVSGAGVYDNGVAWNGLVSVTESPSGAEVNKQYADNIVYASLRSAEEFGATIEAFTYPLEAIPALDGSASPTPGLALGQQGRPTFGFSYVTKVGNDLNPDAGEKIHLVYGATANPSEKAYTTVNDSPEAATFSWELTTSPVQVGTIGGTAYKPLSTITVDTTKEDADAVNTLREFLYGTEGTDPSLPSPAAVVALFSGAVLTATPTEPTYDTTTNVMTVPTITGVQYYMDGELLAPGPQTAFTENHVVEARPAMGYKFTQPTDSDWLIGDF
ncbi:major tail protein [Streptomyces phage Scap1]|uniref:Major tail protein n=1 Tax=Streptomyces phage Scap1 TaxID=2041354 RepID=A0A2D1GP08_9CAUD|nr:major tail protein [Streptomyces phage Scap1]ATN93661.1 major tail protein [Streptomyces phage Scap1]